MSRYKNVVRGWRTIGGRRIFFRSRWEANFARILQFRKEFYIIADWQFEPETFWFHGIRRGVCSYKPDFKIIGNRDSDFCHTWAEVKGFMDKKSEIKIKRFAKYYPHEKLDVYDGKWFAEVGELYAPLIPDWEYAPTKKKKETKNGKKKRNADQPDCDKRQSDQLEN